MIKSLPFALELHARFQTNEFFVSESVFRETLALSRLDGGRQFVLLNASYNSFSYRFISKLVWRELVFICATNNLIQDAADFSLAHA